MKREREMQSDIVRIIRTYYKLLYANKCKNFKGNRQILTKIRLIKPNSRRNRKPE